MHWLYRLQQRLSITRQEGAALVVLAFLFVTGLLVQHVRDQQVPPVTADSLVARPPAPGEGASSADTAFAPEPSPAEPIDLNSAPKEALEALPGIGPALSKRIIAYRTTQRPFQRVEELRRVRGIGPKTMADLRSRIRVEAPDEPSPPGR